jgi:tetratricopeptide (TPR) repeat protein
VALARGDHASAASDIDDGAGQFGDHLGSWIAAGWAHFLAGNAEAATERFQRALDTDDTFGEAHGSLAVMDIVAGRVEEGKRRAEIATRLDPSCFSGALAKILITSSGGDTAKAELIMRRALGTSILPNGQTLEQAIIQSLSVTGPRPS